ncbi:MAG: hypothetical protein K2X93_22030 [Candidatus Obscuribacterales bacterium]|nr:hypothetical protein [Candidatus Obscuribacterales bacterium]
MSITSDAPLKGTCCVCGEPVSPLMGILPPLPGLEAGHCSKCGKSACSKHIKEHTKNCSQGQKSAKDWCGTLGPFQ